MKSFRCFVFMAVSCLTIMGTFIIGCSDDDNPSSSESYGWANLGMGMDNSVTALTVFDNKLIAGGAFTTASGEDVNHIAAWDGSSWTTLGAGVDDNVRALIVFDGKLIAGGDFTAAGGVTASKIAAWDGSSWTALGTGVDYPGESQWTYTLAVFDNKLIVGGQFTKAGDANASHIAAWNGSSWESLGTGVDYPGELITPRVFALAVFDNKLIAGGFFTTAGGVSVNFIASWNGSSWESLGSGLMGNPLAFVVFDNKLIAGGEFTTAGGVTANYIAAWDGSSWTPLGTGMNGRVLSLSVYDNKLIAGGDFTNASGVTASKIAAWDGSSWTALGAGMNTGVAALSMYDGKLIAAGYFTEAGGENANHIAAWGSK